MNIDINSLDEKRVEFANSLKYGMILMSNTNAYIQKDLNTILPNFKSLLLYTGVTAVNCFAALKDPDEIIVHMIIQELKLVNHGLSIDSFGNTLSKLGWSKVPLYDDYHFHSCYLKQGFRISITANSELDRISAKFKYNALTPILFTNSVGGYKLTLNVAALDSLMNKKLTINKNFPVVRKSGGISPVEFNDSYWTNKGFVL